MSRRVRVAIVVAVAAAAAAGVAVGAVVVAGNESETKRPRGVPPFIVDLGVRTDPEAQALRRAAQAYQRGNRARAGEILGARPSLQARVGAALAAWPDESLRRLEELAEANPSSGAVLFHLGLARFWDGDEEGALAAWRTTRARAPDTAYAIRATDLLFRRFPPGQPTFIPSFRAEPRITRLRAPAQLAALARVESDLDALRSSPRGAATSAPSSSTGSRSSGSTGRSRLGGSTRMRLRSRRATRKRSSRTPSGDSTRPIPNVRSRGSVR